MTKDVKVEEQQVLEEINLDDIGDRKIGEKKEKPDLDGKEVTISDVKLIPTNDISTTRDGTKQFKSVMLRVYYGEDIYENYGGVQQFKHGDKFDSPTIWVEGKNAAAVLLRMWAKHVGVEVEDVSLKEFFKGLIGKKVRLKTKTEEYQNEEYRKNIVEEFLGD